MMFMSYYGKRVLKIVFSHFCFNVQPFITSKKYEKNGQAGTLEMRVDVYKNDLPFQRMWDMCAHAHCLVRGACLFGCALYFLKISMHVGIWDSCWLLGALCWHVCLWLLHAFMICCYRMIPRNVTCLSVSPLPSIVKSGSQNEIKWGTQNTPLFLSVKGSSCFACHDGWRVKRFRNTFFLFLLYFELWWQLTKFFGCMPPAMW